MVKRLFVIVTLLLVTGVLAGWYFFAKESRYLGNSPIKAVPVNASLFIRIRNLGNFAGKMVDHSCWKPMAKIRTVGELYNDVVFLDSLLKHYKKEVLFLDQKECYVVRVDNAILYLLEIGTIAEKNCLNTLIRNYFHSIKAIQATEKYKSAILQKYEWNGSLVKHRLYLTFYRGVLMAGETLSALHMAIDQMDKPSLLEDESFRRVNKNTAENTDLNIFVSRKTIACLLADFFPKLHSLENLQSGYSKWTEIDFSQKENGLIMNGFSITDSLTVNYQDIFKGQKPIGGSLTKWMPSTTTFFIAQNLSDSRLYMDHYINYLKKRKLVDSINLHFDELSRVLKFDVLHYMKRSWAGEAATVFTNQNLDDQLDNRFLLIKVRTGQGDSLVAAVKKWATTNRGRLDTESFEAAKSNIWRMPTDQFGRLAGDLYFGGVKTRWITAGNGFLLMGSTPGSLRRYMNLLERNQILAENATYANFANGLAKVYNFYMWCSPGQALPFFEPMLKPEIYRQLLSAALDLKKIDNFSWQWGYENSAAYNSVSLANNLDTLQTEVPFWNYKVKGKIVNSCKFIALSKGSSQKVLVFQDGENDLIVLGNDGLEKWRLSLEGPVMGEIKTIDLNKNGEYQILVNTKDAIHLIDKHGNEMKDFPVRLKSPATNSVAVFDYDNNGEYRFLIVCGDHQIYNFNKQGKPTEGWKPKPTTGMVEFPLHHFRVGSRDYIVCFDRSRTYVLDRQGKERVKLKDAFEHSGNDISLARGDGSDVCMVTTDRKGNIRLIKFDGSIKKMSMGINSEAHYFLPADLNSDGKADFLYFDHQKLSCYDQNGKLQFSFNTAFEIDQAPFLYSTGAVQLISLTSVASNRSILLRGDGTNFYHLAAGNRLLALGSFDEQNQVVSRIEWSSDGVLSNYQMKNIREIFSPIGSKY